MRTSFKAFNKTWSSVNIKEQKIQRILKDLRINSRRAYCLCKGIFNPIPMVSCLREGKYYLKTLNSQYTHASDCRYFKDSTSHNSSSHKAATVITDNGGLNVKLGLDFNTAQKNKQNTEQSSAGRVSEYSTTRAKTSLGGFIKYLYTQANLHYYKPGKDNSIKNAFNIFYHIINNPESCIDRKPAIKTVFTLNPAFSYSDIPNAKVAAPLIIGCITSLKEHKSVYKLDLEGLRKSIYITKDAYMNVSNCNNRIFLNSNLEGYDIAILQIRKKYINNNSILVCEGNNFDILTMDKNLITFDSMYEYRFGNYLAESKREFIKDISDIDKNSFTPDYILRDTYPETYIEVWGMTTEEYLKRKKEKIEMYNKLRNPLLEWNPNIVKIFPELPQKVMDR